MGKKKQKANTPTLLGVNHDFKSHDAKIEDGFPAASKSLLSSIGMAQGRNLCVAINFSESDLEGFVKG